MTKLYIGNKNYSSWSMRSWVLMRELEIPFDEILVRFDSFSFDPNSKFKKTMFDLHPSGTVPVLEHNGMVIADTMAIAEFLAEEFPDRGVWPGSTAARHQARILAAIMHSGFETLRHHCIMNIEADLPEVGAILVRDQAGLRDDIDRLHAVLEPHIRDDSYLFGDYCAADAFYAPVMSRLMTYHLPVSDKMAGYRDRIVQSTSFQDWTREALQEKDFLAFEEPYRIKS